MSDGTVISSVATNPVVGDQTAGATNYIDFGAPHLLNDGAQITFVGSGGGLENDRQYTVIKRDDNTVHLGASFAGGSVNTTNDTINFDFKNNFKTGDFVYYHPEPPVGGVYLAKVNVVDTVFDEASRTFGERLLLPNPQHQLRGGMRCKVHFDGVAAN